MPLQLLPLEEKDAERAAAIEIAAFDPDSIISRILFPNPPPAEGDPRVRKLQDELKADDACRGLKVVDTDLQDRGEDGIIAFAVWYIVESPRAKGPVATVDHGSVCNLEATDAFFGAQGRKKEELIGGKPHAYLRLLSTDPAHHRRGAGALLLKWGLAEADRLRVPSYLETSPAGRGLYEKNGFKQVDSVVTDFSKWGGPPRLEVGVMMREPATA
ncbi:hypothetical protein HJFPF1_09183 [Paramyrothecium foliicola]|nr:hypothetical protein HJFPF1_09183 [Paramyrothecium foliicola]